MYPQEDTIDTQEGEAAHWAGAQRLIGQQIAVGQVAPNGVVLNVEMVEAADGYADHIQQRDKQHEGYWIEQHIPHGPIHKDNYGTPDYVSYANESLSIDDFKYGHGFVSEIGNYQLINYAALKAHELGIFDDDSLKVTMTIHQPRCYHRRGPVRSWTTTLGALRPYFDELRNAFNWATQLDAPVIARDPEACRGCSARFDCEANLMAVGPDVDLAYDSTPLKLSPLAMAVELRKLRRAEKMIKARREGIEQAITSKIQRGQSVPFFSIGHTKGRTVFNADAREMGVVEVAAAYGAKIEKAALITPLQAIKAGVPEDVIKMYSHAQSGAAELVEDDGTAAQNIFNKE